MRSSRRNINLCTGFGNRRCFTDKIECKREWHYIQLVEGAKARPPAPTPAKPPKPASTTADYTATPANHFREARLRGLHTYQLSVISEKKKVKEPMSKLSFRLPGTHHAQPSPTSAPLLSAVGGEPRGVSVRIGDHPGGGQECRVKDGLAPLEGNFGACCHDGYPYQKQEQSDLQGGEGCCQSCIEADEHRDARRDEGRAREVCPEQMGR